MHHWDIQTEGGKNKKIGVKPVLICLVDTNGDKTASGLQIKCLKISQNNNPIIGLQVVKDPMLFLLSNCKTNTIIPWVLLKHN